MNQTDSTSTTTQMQVARDLAQSLMQQGVDVNEVHKALRFLKRCDNGLQFFRFLETVQRDGRVVIRSNRTLAYYRTMNQACKQALWSYRQEPAVMATILGWAIRLMPYFRLEGQLPHPPALAATPPAARKAAAVPPRRSASPTTLDALRPGMEVQGTIVRLAPFGAFVDIGVGHDGLVHISKLRDGFVQKVEDVAQIGDQVTVWVEQVDSARKRIGLTMISPQPTASHSAAAEDPHDHAWAEAPTSAPSAPAQERAAQEPPAPRPASVRLQPGDSATEGHYLYGTVQRIEQNRILVNIGLADPASLTFDRLPGQPTDPDEVAATLPAGTEIEVQVLRVNKRGRVQLGLRD